MQLIQFAARRLGVRVGYLSPVSSQRIGCITDCRHFIMVMLQQRKTSALEETLSDRVPNPHYDTLILANNLGHTNVCLGARMLDVL